MGGTIPSGWIYFYFLFFEVILNGHINETLDTKLLIILNDT